jgi:hypothetical protein
MMPKLVRALGHRHRWMAKKSGALIHVSSRSGTGVSQQESYDTIELLISDLYALFLCNHHTAIPLREAVD